MTGPRVIMLLSVSSKILSPSCEGNDHGMTSISPASFRFKILALWDGVKSEQVNFKPPKWTQLNPLSGTWPNYALERREKD